MASRSASLQPDAPAQRYNTFIQSCFCRHPEAGSYYQQLIDFILSRQAGVRSVERALKAYEFRSRARSTSQTTDHGSSAASMVEVDVHTEASLPRVYVLEGHPSPESVSLLGASLQLRPELFLGHIDFQCANAVPQRHYELPTLPSRRRAVVHIHIVTLCSSLLNETTFDTPNQQRGRAQRATEEYIKGLLLGKRYGSTRFRNVNIHDSRNFSVEQMISFSVSASKEGCVFLLDKGVDDGELLQQQANLPWAAYVHKGQRPGSTACVPYGCYAGGSTTIKSVNKFGDGFSASLSVYNPVNDCITDSDDDRLLMQQDPFFILSQVYLHAAMSWTQLINFVEDDILTWQNAREGHLQSALEQLRFNICLIDRIISYLGESVEVIDNHRQYGWPSASTDTLRQQMSSIEESLRSDYKFLILRCQSLLKRAEVSSGSLVREAQLLEAARGIDQAKKVNSLTLLAYLFLPFSLATGVFGMNVHELNHPPSIWVFVVVALGLSMLGAAAAYWSTILAAMPRIRDGIMTRFRIFWRSTLK